MTRMGLYVSESGQSRSGVWQIRAPSGSPYEVEYLVRVYHTGVGTMHVGTYYKLAEARDAARKAVGQ